MQTCFGLFGEKSCAHFADLNKQTTEFMRDKGQERQSGKNNTFHSINDV